MNSLFKKLGVLGISSAITLASYGYVSAGEDANKYEFSNFGKVIAEKYEGDNNSRVTTVTTADVDGDGDQDIIIGIESMAPHIYIIENKMPQKKK